MTNPLSKYFRQPAVHLNLPSQGRYWEPGSLEMPVTNQLPIYPMTVRDEITIRTPDALMNGSGMIDIIQSCAPNIKNAWNTPNIDVDAILIAIRIASYGQTMDFNSDCPHCKNKNLHGIDLLNQLDQIKCPDYEQTYNYEDLVFKLKPVKYFQITKLNNINFHEQKIYQSLQRPETEIEIRNAELAESMRRILEINISNLAASTEYIELPDGVRVMDEKHIAEFYSNASGTLVKQVQSWLSAINEQMNRKNTEVKCENCNKEYQVPIDYDFSNFFV